MILQGNRRRLARLALLLLPGVLDGCGTPVLRDGGPAPGSVDTSSVPDATPRVEPRSKYGNPDSYVVFGKRYYVMKDAQGYVEKGIASWYGDKFHGRRTSSGETYDMYAMTAAHKTLPLPTYVRVRNLRNGKHVVVKVNDRGPFHENRIIDLSYSAASKLDIVGAGTGLVEVSTIDPAHYTPRPEPVPDTSIGDGIRGFFIQVGAYASRANAENMRRRLGALGDVLVNISEVIVNGTTLYRVRIGPLTDVDNADRIVASLARIGVPEHTIVTD